MCLSFNLTILKSVINYCQRRGIINTFMIIAAAAFFADNTQTVDLSHISGRRIIEAGPMIFVHLFKQRT